MPPDTLRQGILAPTHFTRAILLCTATEQTTSAWKRKPKSISYGTYGSYWDLYWKQSRHGMADLEARRQTSKEPAISRKNATTNQPTTQPNQTETPPRQTRGGWKHAPVYSRGSFGAFTVGEGKGRAEPSRAHR